MIRLAKDTDHIATLTLDMAGEADNLLNHELVDAFQPVLEYLLAEKQRGALRGVVIRSAKRTFLAGGELEYLRRSETPAEVFAMTQRLNGLLRTLESPGVPVVAALNGTALGIGFEFALACHYRVALDAPRSAFGFPEVNLGIMPGAGGCIRLMWLLGLEQAYPLLTSGHRYTPRQALALGLVEEVVGTEAELLERARGYILATPHGARAWDRQGHIPHGTARRAEVANYVVREAARIAAEHRMHYPAYAAILSTLAEGSKVDFDTALRIEARRYTELITGATATNMINAFWFERRELTGGANRPKGFGKFRARAVGVIGAGLMGMGIGYSCARAGLRVVIKDVSRAVALRGRAIAEEEAEAEVARGTLSEPESAALLGRIAFTERNEDFEDCDVVVEAVFENENLKTKVIREVGQRIDEYALLASNTLSIPITRLGRAAARPEQFVGLHFFPPAQTVPLVEIVRGERTSDESIARAFDVARAIKKIPILVRDTWGFYVARVQNTYILEGVTMLLDGYPAALIENLGRQLGFPHGPLALADRLTLELVMGYERQAAEHYGQRYEQHPAVEVLTRMLDEGRGGRVGGQGFYEHAGLADARLWPGLHEAFPATQPGFDRVALEERLLFTQVMEAGWCLQEEVLSLVSEANLGSIYGWGFPANHGGVIQYARQYGREAFLARACALVAENGPRFKVPRAIREVI